MPPGGETLQEEQLAGRTGERNRQETDFYGQNAMISQIEGPL